MDKIKTLADTRDRLKAEFVGISDIIDKVIDSVTPWYLTPEILERPTVVSLWGLTGTGKTSLIRKLVSYLGLSGKALFFDCGEQSGGGESRLFSEKLDDLFENSEAREGSYQYSPEELEKLEVTARTETTRMDPLDYTFVFDEFQYLKTKNENGEEVDRPEGRAIWTLMDSGMVDINSYNYKIKSLMDYLEDMEFFSSAYPGLKISKGRFEKSTNELLKSQLSYYRWAEEDDTGDGGDLGFRVMFDEDFSFLIKKLNVLHRGLGFEVGDKLKTFEKLEDYVLYLKDYIELIGRPKVINCSRSLVFILGNLDEAFDLTSDDLDPDIDADVYHEMTSQVNVMDIKKALRKRFRDEQIGRLGNNIIIYPSLRRRDFEELISRELDRISGKFKDSYQINLGFSENIKKLIYSEGVFPIQGVRPVFTTINSLITPSLSDILLSGLKEATLDTVSGDFNTSKTEIVFKDGPGRVYTLSLGQLRDPGRCKKLAIQAVHEASHAVLYTLLTGKYPSALIASNIFGDGGYMMNQINLDRSVENIQEMKNDVMVSLAGYYGEREFYDPSMCTLGASSDINIVWGRLASAFYDCGYEIPLKFSASSSCDQNEGFPWGIRDSEDEDNPKIGLKKLFKNLCEETKIFIKQERELIGRVALKLTEDRSMSTEVFKEYVEKYKTHDIPGDNTDYYLDVLKEYGN